MSAIDDVIEYVQTYGYKEEAMTARKAADQLAALRAELDKATHDAELLQVATRHAQRNTDMEIQKNDQLRAELEATRSLLEEIYDDAKQGAIPNSNEDWWGKAYMAIAAHPEGKE